MSALMRFLDRVYRIFTRPWVVSVLVAVGAFLLLEFFVWVEQDRRHQAERMAMQAEISTARARLESDLNATLSLSMGLSTFVLTNPGFTQIQLTQVAASLIRLRPNIVSVALAPDNVIRFIYPRGNNDQALGLRFLDNPEQRDAVLRVMREQRPVVAGPLNLVQGGIGLVHRIPIVFLQRDGSLRYWGLAAVAVDPQPFYRQAGILPGDSALLEYALRGKDGRGARGEVFLGSPTLFKDPQAVMMDVVIPGGTWQLAARSIAAPAGVWNSMIHALMLLLGVTIGAMAGYTLRTHQRIKTMALEDSLTGLANRRQFNQFGQDLFALAKRSGRALTLLNMDLDHFKAINDTHGHEVGDKVLIHAARQLRTALRESDLLARVGGDEFLALLPDTASGPQLDTLLARLDAAIKRPVPGVGARLFISISIGAAVCTEDTATLEDLLHRADEAMYRAKAEKKS